MRHRLLDKMQTPAKDGPSDSEWLFKDNLNKRFNNISNTNSVLTRPRYLNRYHFKSHNGGCATGSQIQNSKNFQPSRWSNSREEVAKSKHHFLPQGKKCKSSSSEL